MNEMNDGLGGVVEKYLRRFYKKSKISEEKAQVYDLVMQEVEKQLISVTLDIAKGNRLKTAKILGINRNTLLSKMRQFNLDEKYLEKQEIQKKSKQPLLKRRTRK